MEELSQLRKTLGEYGSTDVTNTSKSYNKSLVFVVVISAIAGFTLRLRRPSSNNKNVKHDDTINDVLFQPFTTP